jgi:alpha-amylase
LGKNFFLIGEVWGGDAQSLDPWFSGDEMDAGFDFSFQGNVLGWLQGRGRTIAFDRYLKSREKVRAGHFLSPYLSSHDVQGALSLLGGDKNLFRLAALLELTSGGIPMIYYGEEVGRAGGDWPDNRSDMPWGDRKILPGAGKPRDETLRADYKKLIAIRRAHPAFARGVHTSLATDGDLLVFLQSEEGSEPRRDAVVVAINRGTATATASFDAPAVWGDRPVRDVWSGEAVSRTGSRIDAAVAPHGARILAVEPFH